MRDALVSDLVMADLDEDDEGSHRRWLTAPLKDPRDWTSHLGRQLELADVEEAGTHDTLLFLVRQLDDLIRTWPPALEEGRACRRLAHEATKNLKPVEVYATLMAGPPSWREHQVEACRIAKLASHMLPLLEKSLTAELNGVVDRWVKWDIRELRKARKAAVEATERAEPATPRAPYRRPQGPERWDRLEPPYRPPGRT